MQTIAENRDNLLHDPAFLEALHREHLTHHKGEPKKIAGYFALPSSLLLPY